MFQLDILEAAQITYSVKCKKHWSNRWKVWGLHLVKIKYIFMINGGMPLYSYFSSNIKAQLFIWVIAQIVFFLKGTGKKKKLFKMYYQSKSINLNVPVVLCTPLLHQLYTHFLFNLPHCTLHVTFPFAKVGVAPIQVDSNWCYSLSSGLSSLWIPTVVGLVWHSERWWFETIHDQGKMPLES